VREVLEQAALGDACASSDDVQAASGEAVRSELGLCILDLCCATSRIDASPCHRRQRVLLGSMTTGHTTVSTVTVKAQMGSVAHRRRLTGSSALTSTHVKRHSAKHAVAEDGGVRQHERYMSRDNDDQ
ncbi:MAG: hypothetical protein QOD97_3381, partial [Mycobacterium sp.]|nr:hypothetical protein [Mycobacterium sp.]